MYFQSKPLRMCWLRIRGKFFNYSIINAHAPTEDKSDIEKNAFYDGLRNLYNACPKYDVKLIIRDLNAQTGKEVIYYPTIQYCPSHPNHTIRLRWSRGSVLAFSTQVRGFKPGRSRRIFKGRKKSSARLPSEGK